MILPAPGGLDRPSPTAVLLQPEGPGADTIVISRMATLHLYPVREAAMREPIESSSTLANDPDLAEQAKPGHGVPSQDPDPAAQFPIDPAHAQAEAQSVFVGGGVLAGVAMGAAVGTAVAGPVGTVVGGTLGALAGAIGGAAAGSLRQPAEDL
jgi:hypothetical protein